MELNGDDLVKDYSDEIERMLGSKMKSVKVSSKFSSTLTTSEVYQWQIINPSKSLTFMKQED